MNPILIKRLFFLFASLLYGNAFAVTPSIQWQKSFGGSGLDHAKCIRQTTDGGLIICGYTHSNDGNVTGNHGSPAQQDAWVIRLDASGNLLWQKTLGGSADDELTSITRLPDGGFVAVGFTRSVDGDVTANHGLADWWVVKLATNGIISWQRTYGGIGDEIANGIDVTSDGGLIVAGYTESSDGNVSINHGGMDYWVMKLSNTGILQWEHTYGNTGSNTGNSIQQTYDGGYIVAGTSDCITGNPTMTNQHSLTDTWILKLSATGNVEWERAYGGSNNEVAKSIVQASDSSYVIAGQTASADGDVTGYHGNALPDVWVLCIEPLGAIRWQRTLGGTGVENARSVVQCSDHGFLIGGSSSSADGDVTGVKSAAADFWLVKLTQAGTLEWAKTLGSTGEDNASGAIETATGEYVITGDVGSGDADVTNSHGGDDLWVVKLAAITTIGGPAGSAERIHLYPNPCKDLLSIDLPQAYAQAPLFLYNAAGALVALNNHNGINRTMDLKSLPGGFYFLKAFTPASVQTISVLKQ